MKPLDYVITYSGREVSPSRGVPSEADLALSLSRQPRFGGMCRRHWTVVDHLLYTALLAERDGQPTEVVLACLLHDAHEWTGDIPTHFKHPAQRNIQREMDYAIYDAYFPGRANGDTYRAVVKQYDHRALLTEALVVGPPKFKISSDVLEHFGERPRLKDVVALIKRINSGELGVDPSEQSYYAQARNAHAFLKKLREYRSKLQGDMTASRHSEPKGFIANEIKGER